MFYFSFCDSCAHGTAVSCSFMGSGRSEKLARAFNSRRRGIHQHKNTDENKSSVVNLTLENVFRTNWKDFLRRNWSLRPIVLFSHSMFQFARIYVFFCEWVTETFYLLWKSTNNIYIYIHVCSSKLGTEKYRIEPPDWNICIWVFLQKIKVKHQLH